MSDDDFPEAPAGVSPYLVWLRAILIWFRRQLVGDVRQFWRWASVEIAAVMAALPMIREYVPEAKDVLTQTQYHYLMTVLAILTILARITRQQPAAPAAQPPEEK